LRYEAIDTVSWSYLSSAVCHIFTGYTVIESYGLKQFFPTEFKFMTFGLPVQKLYHLSCEATDTASWSLLRSVIHRSIRTFNIPPPRATPQAFELLNIGLFKFPPLRAKKLFKCTTN